MNGFTIIGLVFTLLAAIFLAYGRNLDLERHSKKEKENAFKKVIDNIVFGENFDANMMHFQNFLRPEINDIQLKYIYDQVSAHPVRNNTYDFLSMIIDKKSKYADAFYKDLLEKSQGLQEVERTLVYNCFQKDSISAYESELRTYILKTADPTREFIDWCEYLTKTDNNYKINFLTNLFNDNQLIEELNKTHLKEKCKEWENLREERYTYSRFERLAPSWEGTYFEKEIVNLRNNNTNS